MTDVPARPHGNRPFKQSGPPQEAESSAKGLWRVWMQNARRRRPSRLERMAAELRKAGWIVIPPHRPENGKS